MTPPELCTTLDDLPAFLLTEFARGYVPTLGLELTERYYAVWKSLGGVVTYSKD